MKDFNDLVYNKINADFKKEAEDIKIYLEIGKKFSYVEYHTDMLMKSSDNLDRTPFSFIKNIKILNYKNQIYHDLDLKFNFSNNSFKMNTISLKFIDSMQEVDLKIPLLVVDKRIFNDLVEEDVSNLSVELYDKDNLITKEEISFSILPIEIPSLNIIYEPRLYAKYIVSLSPNVKQLTLDAKEYNNNEAFNAYLASDDKKIDEIKAIYDAICNKNITYQMPAHGGLFVIKDKDEYFTQRIRISDEVLNDKKGTCLDLSLLFISALSEIGYHTILFLVDNHAFVGVFLDEKLSFNNGIETNLSYIYNNSTQANMNILLIETTLATEKINFSSSIKHAQEFLKNYQSDITGIDISYCHKTIFKPVISSYVNKELNYINPKEKEDDDNVSIVSTKIIPPVMKDEDDRFKYWQKRLLDLDEGNPLVNLKINISNTIKLLSNNHIYNYLKDNNDILFNMYNKANGFDSASLKELFKLYDEKDQSSLSTMYSLQDGIYGVGEEYTLKKIIRKNQSSLDEKGTPTLYLGLGLLEYDGKNGKIKAPFLILPIKILKTNNNHYKFTYDYDDLLFNETFYEYYKSLGNVLEASYFDNVQDLSKNNYLDIVKTFKSTFINVKLDENYVYITNLMFSHYIMWNDMVQRQDELRKNVIVSSILENHSLISDDLDKPLNNISYNDFASPLYYDSTQLKAILSAANGKSFILDGPPGTGKSQTIVNIIINSFFQGKTILFVAEKKAALDVVYDRLERIGLDRFALLFDPRRSDDNSNKSNFFNKLRESLELGKMKDPKDYTKTILDLDYEKDNINNTINKMHEKKYVLSLYDSLTLYLSLGENDKKELAEEFILSLDEDKYNKILSTINNYVNACKSLKNYDENILKLIGAKNLNLFDKDKIVSEFNELKNKLDNFNNLYEDILKNTELNYKKNPKNILSTLNIIDFIKDNDVFFNKIEEFKLNKDENILILFNDLNSLLNIKEKYQDKLNINDVDKITDDMILELDEKSFFKSISIKKKYKKLLSKYVINNYKINKKELKTYLLDIKNYQELLIKINDNYELISSFVDNNIYNDRLYYNDCVSKYHNTYKLIDLLNELDTRSLEDDISSFKYFKENINDDIKNNINKAKLLLNDYINYEKIMNDNYLFNVDALNNIDDSFNIYHMLIEYVNNKNVSDLVMISNINISLNELYDLGIKNICDEVLMENISYHDLEKYFLRSLSYSLLKYYFKDEDINLFSPIIFDEKVNKYRKLINDYQNLVIEEVSARLTDDFINVADYNKASKKGKLNKLVLSNGRGTTIRNVISEFDDIILNYFPCFLMSPMQVAQYLPLDSKKFDIVIFDEASQIPTYEAIGPISRGNSLVVSGDPMQMPPSMYFQTTVETDDVSLMDSPSFLDECISISLPRIRLKYHYRSKYEELISFSNNNFYDNSLYTFPSPEENNKHIIFNYVEAKDKKKNSSLSKEELNKIIDIFKEIYDNPETQNKSVGIIVFNVNEEEVLLNKLDEVISNDKSLKEKLDKVKDEKGEPYFVKSLENVQGDERDIIILSISFTKNQDGRPRILGPIIRDNGERRLNVCVSRSKEKMIVVSTIKASDFENDEYIDNKGKLLLKRFIHLAEYGYDKKDISKNDVDYIVLSLKKEFDNLGYKTDLNVGDSSFKVNIAFKDENDNYNLGVIIDSYNDDENISLRDRLYVMNNVLNNLKWRLVYIYALEYYKDPKGTIDKIIDALGKDYIKEENNINPHFESEEKQRSFEFNIKERNKYNLPNIKYSKEGIFTPEIYSAIDLIVENEGPICLDDIISIIKSNSNITRLTSSIKTRIYQILSSRNNIIKYTDEQNHVVFYKPKDYIPTCYFKSPTRTLDGISLDEISLCLKDIINLEGEFDNEKDLYREALKLLELSPILHNDEIERFNYAKSLINEDIILDISEE